MKRNNIFNMERFLGLIGTGINRTKNISEFYTIAIFTFLLIAWLFMQMITTFEFDIARKVTTRVYQVTYILFLSAPLFRLSSNQERFMQWNLLPASAFEKYLFYLLWIFVWRTFIFMVVVSAFDHIVWNGAEFNNFSQPVDPSQFYIHIRDIFTFVNIDSSFPEWAGYVLNFFYFATLPLITGIGLISSLNRVSPWTYMYIIYSVLVAFIDNTYSERRRFHIFVALSIISLIAFIYELIHTTVRSCK